jgi:hypothetical protein
VERYASLQLNIRTLSVNYKLTIPQFKLTFPKSYGDVGDLFYHGDIATHYSTASLIQRAVSSDNVNFSDACLASARAALVAHQRCSEKFNIKGNEALWSGYVHWYVHSFINVDI